MTRERAKELLPIIEAYAQGKTVQYQLSENDWIDCHEDRSPFFSAESYRFHKYRIKPEPKLRPWTPEEVPVGALLKYEGTVALIAFANADGFGFVKVWRNLSVSQSKIDDRMWNYDKVYDTIHHSLDQGKTWLPCGVMER